MLWTTKRYRAAAASAEASTICGAENQSIRSPRLNTIWSDTSPTDRIRKPARPKGWTPGRRVRVGAKT